jgi:hypothetical protein
MLAGTPSLSISNVRSPAISKLALESTANSSAVAPRARLQRDMRADAEIPRMQADGPLCQAEVTTFMGDHIMIATNRPRVAATVEACLKDDETCGQLDLFIGVRMYDAGSQVPQQLAGTAQVRLETLEHSGHACKVVLEPCHVLA